MTYTRQGHSVFPKAEGVSGSRNTSTGDHRVRQTHAHLDPTLSHPAHRLEIGNNEGHQVGAHLHGDVKVIFYESFSNVHRFHLLSE